MIRQLFDSNIQFQLKDGSINVGGYLNVYFNIGTVKAITYKDPDGLTLNPFDIELDNNGRAVVYADNAYVYRMEVFDRNKNLLWTQNNISLDSGIAIDGTYVMSIMGDQFIAVNSTTSGDAVTYDLSLNQYAVDSINLVNDDTFGNSALHSDIQSTSSYLDDKINNLDIITIAQSGAGNAFSTFTRIGDTYVFKKENTFLPSANAPVVIAGDNVEVSSSNVNGQMQYTVKANPAGNVTNVISTDNSISILAASAGNDVTYDLSINDIAGANNYAFLKSEMPVNTSMQALEYTDISTSGIHWNTIDQRLEFGDNIKLIDLNFNIEYEIDTANGVAYDDLILYIYSDGQPLEQETFTIDTSIAKHTCKFNKKILDPSNLQFLVKVPKAGSIDATIDINDETFKSITTNGSSGSTYSAGSNIDITDNEISGRDWTPELNAKLDSSAFTLPASANWDNTYNTVSSNSATWSNPAITDVELYSSDGSLLINNTSSGDNVSYNLQLNEQLSAKNYFITRGIYSGMPHSAYSETDYTVKFTTYNPKTDLSANTVKSDWFEYITSEIVIPKEMKLFNVNINFHPKTEYLESPINDNHYFRIYLDDTYVDEFRITVNNLDSFHNIQKTRLIYNPKSADSIFTLRIYAGERYWGWTTIDINDETFRSIGNTTVPDSYDALYSTVNSNSASWSESGGSTYSAGTNINITNSVISGKNWTPELNTKLNTSAFNLPTSANWDNTYNTVSSNSAQWSEGAKPIINNNLVASGILEVNNNEYINVSALDVSGVLTVKAMNTSVINGEPIRQCGGTLSFNTQPSAINFVDSNNTTLAKLDGIPTTFSGNAYQFTIINGVVACQEIK